jgi:hypothetical protein
MNLVIVPIAHQTHMFMGLIRYASPSHTSFPKIRKRPGAVKESQPKYRHKREPSSNRQPPIGKYNLLHKTSTNRLH